MNEITSKEKFAGLAWPVIILLTVVLAGLLVYLLRPVLTPFIVGVALAYLGDPLADRLEKIGMSRTNAVIVVFSGMTIVFVLFVLLMLPLLGRQVDLLRQAFPNWIGWLQVQLMPWLQSLFGLQEDIQLLEKLKAGVSQHWQQAGDIVGNVVAGITQSGMAIVAWIGNLALIPVVTFYMLRDWDVFMAHVRELLPRSRVDVVTRLASECDAVLGSFLRGQLLIMICLGALYAVGLALVGLDLALLLGSIAGLASIVPYLGFIVGLLSAGIAAMMQFQDPVYLLAVLAVFGVGQLAESLFLTPVLVGDRVGLHPVAVIFAVLAGGQLFGFVGVLLGLPVAAVLMVLIRHMHHNYRQSVFYGADEAEEGGAS